MLAEATKRAGGGDAVALRVAEQYVEAFKELAKTNNTILLPGRREFQWISTRTVSEDGSSICQQT